MQICSSDWLASGFLWLQHITPRQRRSWPCYCSVICPRLCFSVWGCFFSRRGPADGSLFELCFLRQVPEWTKCSSREKRKEKKVEKPFYSDSEGESGPTESADSGNCRGAAGSVGAVTSPLVKNKVETLPSSFKAQHQAHWFLLQMFSPLKRDSLGYSF